MSRPERLHRPVTIAEIVEIVNAARRERRTVRAVGAGYSYTPLVDSSHDMVSLDAFSRIEWVDLERGFAKVGAGIRLHSLVRGLAEHGAALENLGDIDRQSLAGAIATGTHGTGLRFASLSSQVAAMTLVDGRGEVVEIAAHSDDELLKSARISLGALGLIVSITLRIEPLYVLRRECSVAEFEEVTDDLDRAVRDNRNFEFYWYPNGGFAYCKRMNAAPQADADRGLAGRGLRWLNDVLVENATVWLAAESTLRWPSLRRPWLQLGRHVAPTDRRTLPADRIYTTPRLVRHHETEYALPLTRAKEALAALGALHETFPSHTMIPIEVRFTAAEDIPLSPSADRDSMYVAVHAYRREDPSEYFARCEDVFTRFSGRPHWGKMHRLRATDLRVLYPRWGEFQKARQTLDPENIFLNRYLQDMLNLG